MLLFGVSDSPVPPGGERAAVDVVAHLLSSLCTGAAWRRRLLHHFVLKPPPQVAAPLQELRGAHAQGGGGVEQRGAQQHLWTGGRGERQVRGSAAESGVSLFLNLIHCKNKNLYLNLKMIFQFSEQKCSVVVRIITKSGRPLMRPSSKVGLTSKVKFAKLTKILRLKLNSLMLIQQRTGFHI